MRRASHLQWLLLFLRHGPSSQAKQHTRNTTSRARRNANRICKNASKKASGFGFVYAPCLGSLLMPAHFQRGGKKSERFVIDTTRPRPRHKTTAHVIRLCLSLCWKMWRGQGVWDGTGPKVVHLWLSRIDLLAQSVSFYYYIILYSSFF